MLQWLSGIRKKISLDTFASYSGVSGYDADTFLTNDVFRTPFNSLLRIFFARSRTF